MLRELQLSGTVPPWYSPVVPKPNYESPEAQAYWDISVFAVREQVRQNRADARFIDHEKKKVLTVAEMSCPWTEKDKRNQRRQPSMPPSAGNSSSSSQNMMITDVLGGWSREVEEAMTELFEARGGEILLRMQKDVISHTLNITHTQKVMS